MEQQQRVWRQRINVSTTSKGAYSFDCTVEGTGFTQEEVLEESDRLVAALRERYTGIPQDDWSKVEATS